MIEYSAKDIFLTRSNLVVEKYNNKIAERRRIIYGSNCGLGDLLYAKKTRFSEYMSTSIVRSYY